MQVTISDNQNHNNLHNNKFFESSHDNKIKKKRECGLELLRFIFISTIIWNHIAVSLDSSLFSLSIGVVGFFLITGFFGSDAKKNRFWKFFTTVLIYTVLGFVFYTIAFCTGLNSWNPLNFFTKLEFFQDIRNSWWFFYTMLVVVALQPLLNKFLFLWNKWIIFAIIICLWIGCYIILHIDVNIYSSINFFLIFYGIIIYLIGGWFKQFVYVFFAKNKKNKNISIVISLVLVILIIVFFVFFPNNSVFDGKINWHKVAINQLFILNVLCALSLINIFSFIKIKNIKWLVPINEIFLWIGKISLSLYLFHGLIYEIIYVMLPGLSGPEYFFITMGFTLIIGSAITFFTMSCEKIIDEIKIYISNKKNKKNIF